MRGKIFATPRQRRLGNRIEIEVMKDTGIDLEVTASGFYTMDTKDGYSLAKKNFDEVIADLDELSVAIRETKAYLKEQRKLVKA